jgi:hypothetical protein
MTEVRPDSAETHALLDRVACHAAAALDALLVHNRAACPTSSTSTSTPACGRGLIPPT